MILSALVRIIIAIAVLFLIVIPACNKLRAYLSNSETESFGAFVDKINKMDSNSKEDFAFRLEEKSAVVGFSKDANRYECFNCYVGTASPRATIIFNRPADQDGCSGGVPCACLCSSLKLEQENPKVAQCSSLLCKKISSATMGNLDVTGKTIVKKYPFGGTEHWNNGFLFVNGVAGANGLRLYNENPMLLYIEKKGNIIGVCNKDILDLNRDALHLPEGTCINKDSG